MKRSPIKQLGKNKHDSPSLRRITPYLAERAGGMWLGWKTGGQHAMDCQCEICTAYLRDVIGHRAHINERKSEKDDAIENIIIACDACHDHDKYPDGGLACGTAKALEIVAERNDREHGIKEG